MWTAGTVEHLLDKAREADLPWPIRPVGGGPLPPVWQLDAMPPPASDPIHWMWLPLALEWIPKDGLASTFPLPVLFVDQPRAGAHRFYVSVSALWHLFPAATPVGTFFRKTNEALWDLVGHMDITYDRDLVPSRRSTSRLPGHTHADVADGAIVGGGFFASTSLLLGAMAFLLHAPSQSKAFQVVASTLVSTLARTARLENLTGLALVEGVVNGDDLEAMLVEHGLAVDGG